MYNNIGAKIKTLAQVIAWVGIIGSVLVGIIMIAQGTGSRGDGSIVGIGVAYLLAGPFISWIASWFMYGFGELIEKTTQIEINTSRGFPTSSLTAKMENDEKMKTLISWRDQNLISEEEFDIKKQALLKGE